MAGDQSFRCCGGKYWFNLQTVSETKFCFSLKNHRGGFYFFIRIATNKGGPGKHSAPIDVNAFRGSYIANEYRGVSSP